MLVALVNTAIRRLGFVLLRTRMMYEKLSLVHPVTYCLSCWRKVNGKWMKEMPLKPGTWRRFNLMEGWMRGDFSVFFFSRLKVPLLAQQRLFFFRLLPLVLVGRGCCTHTPCGTHIFLTCSLRGVQTSRARVAQGVCSAHVTSLHLPLHSHVSSAVFAVPARSLRDHISVCTVFAELFPIRKRGSSALPHERRGVWPLGRSHALHRL